MQTLYKFALMFLTLGSFKHFNEALQTSAFNNDIQSYWNINKSNITLEDIKDLFVKKCQKAVLSGSVSAETQYKSIESAANNLANCVNSIVNVTAVMTEYEEVLPNGNLDIFFEKYCRKMPRMKQCLTDFNDQLLTCLTPSEREQNAIMMQITKRLLDFACDTGGAHLGVFVAEEGLECIESHQLDIVNCMNATFAAYIPKTLPSELPELVLGPKQCIDLHDFGECVLSYVEKCNEVTPANLIESLFRYVRRETKCQAEIDKVIERNSPQRNLATTGTVFGWSLLYAMSSAVMVMVFKLNH